MKAVSFSKDKIDWERFSRDRSNLFLNPNADEEQAYFDLSRAFNVLNRSIHAQKTWNSNSKLALLNELIGKILHNEIKMKTFELIFSTTITMEIGICC